MSKKLYMVMGGGLNQVCLHSSKQNAMFSGLMLAIFMLIKAGLPLFTLLF
jgi:hypothetical protein